MASRFPGQRAQRIQARRERVSKEMRDLNMARRLGKDKTLWWEIAGIVLFVAAIAAVIIFVH